MGNRSPATPHVLIADDQPDVLEALRLLLKVEGYRTESATSPSGILSAIEARDFDVAIMDLNYARDTTSGQEGLDLLTKINTIDSTLPVVMMTAWGTIELAVEAMRRGARDFIQKPWGESPPPGDRPYADRTLPNAAERTATRSGEPAAARRGTTELYC